MSGEPAAIPAAAPRTVLVVDDEAAHRELIARAFAAASGFRLREAASAAAARAELTGGGVDLVLTDYRLPDGAGIDLLAAAADRPFVLMTAQGNEQLAVAVLKAGAADYIVKSPEMFAALPRLCTRLLAEHELRREREQLGRRLREQQAELIAIYEHAPLIIFIVDATGAVRQANQTAAARVGVPADFLAGRTRAQVLRCANAVADPAGCGLGDACRDCGLRLLIAAAFATGVDQPQRELRVSLDSDRFADEAWFLGSASILSRGGEPLVLVSLLDITVRKQAEERMQQASRFAAAGQLAAGVAHEFNNVLQIIRSAVQAADARQSADGATIELQAEIIRQVERGAGLARGMLNFARPGAPQRSLFALAGAVARAVGLQQNQLQREGVTVSVSIPGGLQVDADTAQFEQVLINLFINARHALRPRGGGRISIGAAVEPGCLRFEFSDNGIGMSEEVREKALLPFFTTKGAFGDGEVSGTGLGLAIVDAITRAHGGTCSLDSAPGRGTTVRLILPQPVARTESAAAESAAMPAADGDPTSICGARLLVVDDEPALRISIGSFLRDRGAVVNVAGDGPQARAALADGRYAAVLLDLNLPAVRDIELVRDALAAQPQAKIVLMTGELDLDTRRAELAALGVTRCLAKPFDLRVLLHTLAS